MTLREARQAAGISQGALAGRARVSPSLLSFAENGRFRLSRAQAVKLAGVLGVKVGDVSELAEAVEGGEVADLAEAVGAEGRQDG